MAGTELDRRWLSTVSKYRAGLASSVEVATESWDWLAGDGSADLLLPLIDAASSKALLSSEVFSRIDAILTAYGRTPISYRGYLWFTAYELARGEFSLPAYQLARYLSRLSQLSDQDFDLLREFVADVDFFEEELPPAPIEAEVVSRFARVRPELASRAMENLCDSQEDAWAAEWLRDHMGGR